MAEHVSIYDRIASIVGDHLNRSELIKVVSLMEWIPLGRNEKRIKALLIQRLESARDRILPFLEDQNGIMALRGAYMSVRTKKTVEEEEPPPDLTLPPEATIEFYINKHYEQRALQRSGLCDASEAFASE
jgi:hypothetical protein